MSEINPQLDIRIGTVVGARNKTRFIEQTVDLGFESFSLCFKPEDANLDFYQLADSLHHILEGTGATISSLAVYGNPLGEEWADYETVKVWERLIDHADLFGADIVAGFTGRVRGACVEESIEQYKKVFTPLAERAEGKSVRIAFENCAKGGNWQTGDFNIAINPDAWDMIFEAVGSPNLGLQWEPAHQMIQLIDPRPQLREWLSRGRIFHIHGKDATIHWDVIRRCGVNGRTPYAWHRTPGFGECDWTGIISDLRQGGFHGSIDIEGWHDPVWRGELEMTGQCRALQYLRECRGGDYVPNPEE